VSITCKSIPSGAQYVTLQKYFSHPSLVIYFLATPPLRLKLRLQTGERLPNQLDQSETGSSSQFIFIYTLLWQVHSFDVHFTSLSKLCKYAKPFCWAKSACFDFSSCNFNVQGHVLSTAGDALTTTIMELKFKEQQQQQQTWVRIKPDTGEKQVGRREQPAADPGYNYPLQLFLFSACLPACPLCLSLFFAPDLTLAILINRYWGLQNAHTLVAKIPNPKTTQTSNDYSYHNLCVWHNKQRNDAKWKWLSTARSKFPAD